MAISAIETLCPHRYAAEPGTGVLTVHTRLLLTSATDGPEEAVQLTLVVVDMFDTERSRGTLAMEAAAWLEGQVRLYRIGQEVSLHAIGQQCRSDGGEYLLVVVWVPYERLQLLQLGDYVPGVGLPGLPTGCIVVTDAPGSVPHASVDILVGTRLDPIADAARVTRMASSLHASETLTCADIFDFSHALAKGSYAECVDAFWCESSPDVILFGSPEDAALVAGTAGAVMTMHVPQSLKSQAYKNALRALQSCVRPEADWICHIATGQRVDQLDSPARQLDLLIVATCQAGTK